MKALVLTTLFAACLAAPAVAETRSDEDPDRRICKTQKKTGSRVPIKTCRTKAEWDALAEESRDATKEMADKPMIQMSPNP
jgi:hypothetical protein